ncbi:MAG: LPS assembly lipoprotein LptE [bacterium]|nr:LPS assembly lipoprotein LptE [bacterium]MDY2829857.1 LPS assembly lipoprotein LptE [Alphaproteobacteria bacterium]
MRKFGLFLSVLLLAACGFQPLYVTKTGGKWYYDGKFDVSITDEMSQINVLPIADRFGQILRNDLLDLLTPKGKPKQAKYRLQVTLKDKSVTQQAMRNDVTATNERIQYKVDYTLYSGTTQLVSGDSIAFVSYDILANPYSTTMAQKKAESDAAQILANDIALRIGAYFHTEMNPAR